MNQNLIRRLFPHASQSLISANPANESDVALEARILSTEPAQPTAPLASGSEGEAQGSSRPLVRFTLRRTKLLDVDAKYGVLKHLIDGIAYAGLIHGDREDQIRLEVCQEKVAHRKEQETIIEIEYP